MNREWKFKVFIAGIRKAVTGDWLSVASLQVYQSPATNHAFFLTRKSCPVISLG